MINDKFEEIIRKRKKFNGEPFSHWEQKAEEVAIEVMARASLNLDGQSLVGYLAAERLMTLAQKANPTVLQRIMTQRDLCLSGLSKVMKDILH